MSPELQEQLYEKYPRILASLGNPSSPASCTMDCGDGWYRLVERLLDYVQDLADEQGAMQHVAVQVKEKFGSLRVHWVASDERVDAMTVFAQALSCFICEQCGNPATRDTNGVDHDALRQALVAALTTWRVCQCIDGSAAVRHDGWAGLLQ